jgi:TetR/AcrR family transcriptional regulator, lmrAB and yxaGH operons repressor
MTGMATVKDEQRAPDTRERILAASTELFRHRGYAGTGLKAVVASSRAPYGSLYHFFPGGKEELGVAAITSSGAMYRALVESFYPEGVDLVVATREFFKGAAQVLEGATDYADACPIATIALEIASTSEPMRIAASEAFESWLAILQRRLVEAGVDDVPAREVAVELFCAMEGAFLLCRTNRSTEAMEITGRSATRAVEAALRSVTTR